MPGLTVEEMRLAIDGVEDPRYSGGYGVPGQLRWVDDSFTPQGLTKLAEGVVASTEDLRPENMRTRDLWAIRQGARLGGVVLLAARMSFSVISSRISGLPRGAIGHSQYVVDRFSVTLGGESTAALMRWQDEAYTRTANDNLVTTGSLALLLAMLEGQTLQTGNPEKVTPTDAQFDEFLRGLNSQPD